DRFEHHGSSRGDDPTHDLLYARDRCDRRGRFRRRRGCLRGARARDAADRTDPSTTVAAGETIPPMSCFPRATGVIAGAASAAGAAACAVRAPAMMNAMPLMNSAALMTNNQ